MRRDKHKRIEIKYFLVPFLFLTLGSALITYFLASRRIEERYETLKNTSINIAESYSHSLTNSKEAYDIILELLDEKIMVASQAIMLIEDKEDNEILTDIAEKFNVDEIYLYNDEGEIFFSTIEELIGWKAFDGHPVFDFMTSDQVTLVEDIRPDTENGEYYKFGYVKDGKGWFVQIGVLAENIQNFLGSFEIEKLIEDISNRGDVKQAFFVNSNYEIIESSHPQYIGHIVEGEEIRHNIDNNKPNVLRDKIDDSEILRVCVPIFSADNKLGTLSIAWPIDEINAEIRDVVMNGTMILLMAVIIIGTILYYAYRKNKSNIQIAYYDKLTGLPNSEYLIEYLEGMEKSPGKSSKAIMLLNCRNFRTLNMTYGFLFGNRILKQIALKVMSLVGPDNMFFRFDGDRFILVLEQYRDDEELNDMALKLVSIFENPFNEGKEKQYINVEIAIVEIRDNNTSVDRILQDATLALSCINGTTKEQIIFFNDEMKEVALRKNKIAKVIRAVTEGNHTESFYLEFQPKLDLKNNKIAGFEALARLNIQGMGQISPVEFIAIAEEELLIYELGNLILQQSIAFMTQLKDKGYKEIGVAVNISGIQLLREEFVENIRENVVGALSEGLSLEFEITESVLIEDFDLINEKLDQIKKMGITVSLDDFGTGFSSFSRLRELNIDAVKIDKNFIDKILDKNEDSLITADIISMSHKIGLTVIAEGVEAEKQKVYLNKYGCDILQGYLLSKPMRADHAAEFLAGYS